MVNKIGGGFDFQHRDTARGDTDPDERKYDGITDGAYWSAKGMQWLLYRILPILFVVGAVAYFVFGWRPQ